MRQPTEDVPVMTLPGTVPVVERQPERQNRLVNIVLIDLHSHRERQQLGFRQASMQLMA